MDLQIYSFKYDLLDIPAYFHFCLSDPVLPSPLLEQAQDFMKQIPVAIDLNKTSNYLKICSLPRTFKFRN